MTFADVTDQNHVKITIQNQIASGTVAHAYLFAGPRGVGKTTVARLLAKTLNCESRKADGKEPCNACANCTEMNAGKSLDIVEIDAASHTGVDNVRENIIESVRFSPSKSKYKVFIIDEVHMLSTSAFNALLKTLEEPPAHALFILATTEIHKIPATILSRCQRFDFHKIAVADMIARLKEMAKSEGVKVSDDVFAQIAKLSEGCLRDAESLLGQIFALDEKEIGEKEASMILPMTNTVVVTDFVDAVLHFEAARAVQILNDFVDDGGSIKHFTDESIAFVRDMLLKALSDQASADAKQCARLLDALLESKARPAYDALPHLPLEIAVVLFCDAQTVGKVETGGVVLAEKKREIPVEKPIEKTVPTPAAPILEVLSFTLDEIQSKWKRCCEAVGKRSVALPLALMNAEPSKIDGDAVEISFKYAFHFDTMSEPKNQKILSDSINEVMQSNVTIRPILAGAKEAEVLSNLVEAFGGQVIE